MILSLQRSQSHLRGPLFLTLGMLIMSLQDVTVKSVGGNYSVLEIVLLRSLTALPFALLFVRMEGHRGLPTTRRPMLEYLRGLLLFISFTTHMMGVAALPLADVGAIRNSAPLMITLLSVFVLGEKVGLRHWIVLLVGFAGVLLIVQPGSTAFNPGAIFAIIATFTYALAAMITRRLQSTDSSASMAYFSAIAYLVLSFIAAPLAGLVGETAGAHPSLAFLLRSWSTPTLPDLMIFCGLGLVWAAGMYFVARAYSSAPASLVAPFEYSSLLINVVWGFLLWHELPTVTTIAGAMLTLGSGLYLLTQERR